MCVICVKPRGKKMPSKTLLRAMATANPDGFGFVSESDYYRTMNFDDFCKRVRKVNKNENLIIHFRWATHGSKKTENCHPFTDGETYFAHNGVLSLPSINDKTDSELCFVRYIMPAIEALGIEGAKDVIDSHREGSRFAIMHKGEMYMYGDFREMNGCFFSNLRFLPFCTHR